MGMDVLLIIDEVNKQSLPTPSPETKLRILVTGAGGLVGRAFVSLAEREGHSIVQLAHKPREGAIHWDIANKRLDPEQIEGMSAVVHLDGESIVGLWTAEKKRRIMSSRIESTHLLATTLARLKCPPEVFVSASAIGYYGANAGEVDETANNGNGFLAEVCRRWEASAEPARDAGIRVVHPRIGVVLSEYGGALQAMLPAFKAGIAGRLGNGKQGMSWIMLEDLVRSILFSITNKSLQGAFNATAPGSVDNTTFTQTLAQTLGKPAFLPAPAFLLKAVLGDMAREMLLADVFAHPQKLLNAGFIFQYPELSAAFLTIYPSPSASGGVFLRGKREACRQVSRWR